MALIKKTLYLGSTITTLLLGSIVLFSTYSAMADSELKPFTSDGCSSFPDGTLKQKTLWQGCCTQHDIEYWRGGTYDERLQADKALAQCVAKVGKPKVAKLMLAGVRVGGSPYFPTSYRWGYGWPYFRGYGALTDDELQAVEKIFRNTDFVDYE